MKIAAVVAVLAVSAHQPAFAGEADVLDVDVSCNCESVCRFDVTVKHADDG